MKIFTNLKRIYKRIFFPDLEIGYRQLKLLKKVSGKNKLILEIGSFEGGTTMQLGKKNIVIAVDPYEPYSEDLKGYDDASRKISINPEEVLSTFKRNTKNKNVILIRKKSGELLKIWEEINVKFDGVFIDGLHNKENVTIDSKWIKYIKKGGFIAFHDINHPEINEFIRKNIIPKYECIGKIECLQIFIK